jgi:hypothetical protein
MTQPAGARAILGTMVVPSGWPINHDYGELVLTNSIGASVARQGEFVRATEGWA